MAKSVKKSKKPKVEKELSDDDGNIQDERFQKAQTHPQFQKLHTRRKQEGEDGNLITSSLDKDKEGETDDRFKAMLTDSRFALGGDVGLAVGGIDKYGRKQKKKKKVLKLEDVNEKEDPATSGTEDNNSDGNDSDSNNDSDNDQDGDDMPEDPESRIAFLTALSRGEVNVSSSSEDESSSDEEDGDNSSDDDNDDTEDTLYGRAGVLDPSTKDETIDPEVEITFGDSKFLAVCNTDWSSVRAVDLFAIASSFAPPGCVKYVKVFPSDFGTERMKNDATLGPQGIWKKTNSNIGNDSDDRDGSSDDNSNGSEIENSSGNEDNDQSESDDNTSESQQKDDKDKESEDDESDIDEDELLKETYKHFDTDHNDELMDNDFDAEKLRAYEASKMKYYFAVVEFTTSKAADAAYKELDGMEVGHSSARMDLRAIPEADVEGVLEGRTSRDQAITIPSNYSPPDFVVAALQQTAVKCTWEQGDKERERLLTQYGVGNDAWQAMTEGDDLGAYLASDGSSDDESDAEGDTGGKDGKAKNLRALLGLGGSDDDDKDDFLQEGSVASDAGGEDDDSFFGSGNLDSDSDGGGGETKQVTFIPGKSSLEEKIRTKLKEKEEGTEELTPWEKFQDKRKEKRKERKRLNKQQKSSFRGEDGEADPFASTSKRTNAVKTKPSTKEELDLLLAGDNDEEAAKDFHMRDLVRIEKNKSKKLRGSRKRKEAEMKNNAVGLDFKLDTKDNRFAAVLEGSDDRFGIDRTDPQYKETPAMREILTEQTKRRKSNKRGRKSENTDVSAEAMMTGKAESSGALALSSLVKNLKSKVAKSSN